MDTISRQKWQRGIDKLKSRQKYLKNRGKSKAKSRQRYRRVRKQPSFKKKQRIRRKKPWLSKRKRADMENSIQPADISFIHPDTGEVVGIEAVHPFDDTVQFIDQEGNTGSMEIGDVLERAGFPSWDDIEAFYDMLDNVYLTEEEDQGFDNNDLEEALQFGDEPDEEKLWDVLERMARRQGMINNVVKKYLER